MSHVPMRTQDEQYQRHYKMAYHYTIMLESQFTKYKSFSIPGEEKQKKMTAPVGPLPHMHGRIQSFKIISKI